MAEPILLAKHGDTECFLLPALANRHGLITGATGTGKTVTLQTLAENFSRQRRAGVHGRRQGRPHRHQPAGQHRRQAGGDPEGARHRAAGAGGLPGDAVGRVRRRQGGQGHPVRATVSDMGPLLLARMLDLNETQAGRAAAGLQDRRRQRPAAARPEGPARDAAARRRQRGAVPRPSTATSARPASARSSAA